MHSRDDFGIAPRATISLLGPMTVCLGDKPVAYNARKGLALLAFLARRSGSSATRETLSGLLWGDADDVQARASLRQTLSGLRKALTIDGRDLLKADGSGVSLAEADIEIDALAFERLSSSDDIDSLKSAASLYRGDFLEGFAPVTPDFDRWLDAERSGLHARFCAMLLRLCDVCSNAGRTEDVIATAHRLIQLDPLQEHVHRRLMQAFLTQKRHDAALRQFESLKTLLAEELGVSPEPQTLDLVAEVRRQRSGPGARAVPHGAGPEFTELAHRQLVEPERPSIAVLPFRSLSAAEDAALFGEGISEEIIVELAREAGLLVLSSGSSFQSNLRDVSSADIGTRLGVRFLLTGSARISGDRVRVTAHLIQCSTGRELWVDRYDRDLIDIFAIQTDIARTVTATVVGRIAKVDAEASGQRPLGSLEGYSLVAQGQRHFLSYSLEGYAAAAECFERAVALDPDYGRAFGLLALTHIYRRWYFEMSTDVGDFLPLAERSLALDHRDAKGHCALGLGHTILRNFTKAGLHFQIGLQANPNDDLLLIEYGRYLLYTDRPEEGLRHVREAMRLNPYHPNWYWNIQGRCLHTLGRHREALEAFQRITTPTYWVYVYLSACHRHLGDPKAAEEARAMLFRLRPNFDMGQFAEIFPYENADVARRFLEDLAFGAPDLPGPTP